MMSLVHEAALFSGDFSQREVVRLPGNAVRICHVARQLAEAVYTHAVAVYLIQATVNL